jgi:Ca2+-binding RTX toxin-like protein
MAEMGSVEIKPTPLPFIPLESLGGNDTINGGAGTNGLFGELGDDYLDGGADADVLFRQCQVRRRRGSVERCPSKTYWAAGTLRKRGALFPTQHGKHRNIPLSINEIHAQGCGGA